MKLYSVPDGQKFPLADWYCHIIDNADDTDAAWLSEDRG